MNEPFEVNDENYENYGPVIKYSPQFPPETESLEESLTFSPPRYFNQNLNLTQALGKPMSNVCDTLFSSPPTIEQLVEDENDGPSVFNMLSVSPPPSPVMFPDYYSEQSKRAKHFYPTQSKKVKR